MLSPSGPARALRRRRRPPDQRVATLVQSSEQANARAVGPDDPDRERQARRSGGVLPQVGEPTPVGRPGDVVEAGGSHEHALAATLWIDDAERVVRRGVLPPAEER